tara:strand:+ start:65 stop:334 length:270 start_codon:yes stop_codon:yes gene_type:complete
MSSVKELEKEIKENLFQLDKDELKIIIRYIQSMINKKYMGEELGIQKYEELCEVLVGIDATERYTFKEILAYAYTLKNIEERYNDGEKK